MKPDAVNVGVPKFSVGQLAAWTHDIHIHKYDFVFSEALITKIIEHNDGTYFYEVIILNGGNKFSCFERNLRTIEEAKKSWPPK